MSAPIFPKLLMSTANQMSLILVIMLVRACYESTGDYSSELIPETWRNQAVAIAWAGAADPWTCSVSALCELMKVNLWARDECTGIIRTIMQETEKACYYLLRLYIVCWFRNCYSLVI